MNQPTDPNETKAGFFRCPVQSERAKANIRIGRKNVKLTIQETSIDGFTVLVEPRLANKIKVGRPWVLEYDGTRHEVHPQWFFNSPDGHVQMGLRRLRDLTELPTIKSSWFANLAKGRCDDASNSAIVFGGVVLLLLVLMATPALGDRLGTSDHIRSAVHWITSGVKGTIDAWT